MYVCRGSGEPSAAVNRDRGRGWRCPDELSNVVVCTTEEGEELDKRLKEIFGDRYISNDTYASEMTDDV